MVWGVAPYRGKENKLKWTIKGRGKMPEIKTKTNRANDQGGRQQGVKNHIQRRGREKGKNKGPGGGG